MSTTSNRVYGLDILKALCAFCIILIHFPLPGRTGLAIDSLTRIAVPVFFMITGFFYADTKTRKKELKQIKKILLLCLYSNALYFLLGLFLNLSSGAADIKSYLFQTFTPKAVFECLICNTSPIAGHLWYLNALLYVLIIVYFLDCLFSDKASKILLAATPFLLLGNLLLGTYSMLVFHKSIPLIYTRNFLFVGIPYFTLGYFLREHKEYIDILNSRPVLLFPSILFFATTSIFELYLIRRTGLIASKDHFICTPFLSVLVFSAFTNPYWDKKLPVLNFIGRKYSVYIYIIHPLIFLVINIVLYKLNLKDMNVYFRPIVIYAISLLISMLYVKVKSFLSYRNSVI